MERTCNSRARPKTDVLQIVARDQACHDRNKSYGWITFIPQMPKSSTQTVQLKSIPNCYATSMLHFWLSLKGARIKTGIPGTEADLCHLSTSAIGQPRWQIPALRINASQNRKTNYDSSIRLYRFNNLRKDYIKLKSYYYTSRRPINKSGNLRKYNQTLTISVRSIWRFTKTLATNPGWDPRKAWWKEIHTSEKARSTSQSDGLYYMSSGMELQAPVIRGVTRSAFNFG